MFLLQEYVSLLSEYIHSVLHDDSHADLVRDLVNRVWTTLKRSTKAGPRKTVMGCLMKFPAGNPRMIFLQTGVAILLILQELSQNL